MRVRMLQAPGFASAPLRRGRRHVARAARWIADAAAGARLDVAAAVDSDEPWRTVATMAAAVAAALFGGLSGPPPLLFRWRMRPRPPAGGRAAAAGASRRRAAPLPPSMLCPWTCGPRFRGVGLPRHRPCLLVEAASADGSGGVAALACCSSDPGARGGAPQCPCSLERPTCQNRAGRLDSGGGRAMWRDPSRLQPRPQAPQNGALTAGRRQLVGHRPSPSSPPKSGVCGSCATACRGLQHLLAAGIALPSDLSAEAARGPLTGRLPAFASAHIARSAACVRKYIGASAGYRRPWMWAGLATVLLLEVELKLRKTMWVCLLACLGICMGGWMGGRMCGWMCGWVGEWVGVHMRDLFVRAATMLLCAHAHACALVVALAMPTSSGTTPALDRRRARAQPWCVGVRMGAPAPARPAPYIGFIDGVVWRSPAGRCPCRPSGIVPAPSGLGCVLASAGYAAHINRTLLTHSSTAAAPTPW